MAARIRPLVLTWLALMALLAITAAVAWVPLGWVNTAISLGIALAKALLVALVFMRLRRAHGLLRLTAVAGVVTLLLLFGLSATDYATRTAPPSKVWMPCSMQNSSGW
jgi:cytochrome c oxidase subunit 4